LRHPWVTASHSAATSPGPRRESSCSPMPTDNIQHRLHPQQLHLVNGCTAAAAAAAAVPLQSRDGTPIASRLSQVQATPRDASRGCVVEALATPLAQQQQQLASPSSGSCCSAACGRSHSGASVVAAPATPGAGPRSQYSFTPSQLGSRSATGASSAALHGSRGAAQQQLHQTHAHSLQSGACCYSASAPQTPVQQVPFRGIQGTTSAAGSSANSNSGMPTALLERRRVSRCESQDPRTGQASSPMHSPTRRPRSSGPPQTHLPTRGARQVDLVNTSISSTQLGGSPVAPPTPAHRKPAVPRVGGGLGVAGHAAPGSPKPCGAGRSLSPSGPPSGSYPAAAAAGAVAAALASAPVPTAYGGHRSGNVVRQNQMYAQRTRSPSRG